MVRLLLLPLLLLAGCANAPDAVPLSVVEANAVRRAGPGRDAAAVIAMLVPPGSSAPGVQTPSLPSTFGVLVRLNEAPLAVVRPHEALLIPAPDGPVRIGAGAHSPMQGGRTGTLDLQVAGPHPRFVALDFRPAGAASPARFDVQPLAAELGEALLPARTLVRGGSATPPTPSASALRAIVDPVSDAAVAEGRVPSDRGRLLVAPAAWLNQRGGLAAALPNLATVRGDIVVEGVPVGFIHAEEVLAVDLPPGPYALHWRLRGGIGDQRYHPDGAVALPLALAVRPGTTTVLAAEVLDRTSLRIVPGLPGMPLAQQEGVRFTILTAVPDAEVPRLLSGRPVVVPPLSALAALPGAALPGR